MAITKVTSGVRDLGTGEVVAGDLASTLDLSGKTVTLAPASVTAHVTQTDTTSVEGAIALLGFRVSANGSFAKYKLVDQIIDDYQDATGINASASTNELRDNTNFYSGTAAGAVISATGGAGAASNNAGAGGVGSGGASQGTGGAGSAANTSTASNGNAGTNGGAGGGGGGSGSDAGGDGGAGDAASFSGGGGGGGSDYDGAGGGVQPGGAGYKAGGSGGNVGTAATDGVGIGGNGSTYGGGDVTQAGSDRKNNGGGGGAFGGGGGGAADPANDGSTNAGGGGGGIGGVVIVYTDASSNPQTITRFTGTSYTVPAGSTNLTVHVIGGGGGGTQGGTGNADGGGGGGGGGHAKTSEYSDGGREVTYSVGAAGAGSAVDGATAGSGGTTTATIAGVAENLTLVSTTTAAQDAPTKGDIVLTYSNGLGGSTWTPTTLTSEGSTGTHNIAVAHNVTLISTITDPANMAYRLKTLNQDASKGTRIHAVSLGWS